MNLDPKKTLFLIDGSSFLYRAYYGIRPLHTIKGIPVHAVYSFCRMIKKLIDRFHPQYIAIIWDSKGKTTRHDMFEHYKAKREAPPSDLFEQKKYIVQFAQLIGMHQVAQQGIEADDIMFSIAQEQKALGNTTVLITSDKDMGQTVDSQRIMIFDAWKDILYDQAAFEKKVGVPIAKLPFYFALLGDTSDNIPGVRGIGEKGALELVYQFDSLEQLYDNLDKVTKERTRAALIANKENAFLSYRLFLLQMHPSHLQLSDFAFDEKNWVKALPLFQELQFQSLVKEIAALEKINAGVSPTVAQKMVEYDFITILSADQLESLGNMLRQKKLFACDTETDTVTPLLANSCVGISFCVQEGTAYYLPFGHKNMQQLPRDYVVDQLRSIFEDPTIKKIFHNAKFDQEALLSIGISVQGISFDTLIAANLTTKDWQRIGLKYLSEYYFQEPMLTFQEVVKDNKFKNFSYVPLDLATRYAAADAHQTLRLAPLLEKELHEQNLWQLYSTVEFPLVQVLYEMEVEGILLDTHLLASIGAQVERELQDIINEIGQKIGIAMSEINLNSPKQVEQLLFVTLQLPPQKKSAKRTGFSTDQEVLQILSSMHPVPALIMKHRELSKLKSTYIDALPETFNQHTKKIHTWFSQITVPTGRLSSSDPNLQNIPTNTSYGLEIRAAFIPKPGDIFLSADYSQIELRVLAYLSQDQNLIEAFLHNRDIHTETASALFDVAPELVTHEQRQIGKRINFSVLYGMTPFGLSQDLGIPFKDAKIYIERYFAKYPQVSAWMEQVIVDTKHNGYVTTHWGRRRWISAIYEKNRALYEEARRVAINTVAQGTAAEIVKQGMIALNTHFKEKKLNTKIVLQIHDELLLTVPRTEIDLVTVLTKSTLENVVQWNVPLIVTTRSGNNWKEVTK